MKRITAAVTVILSIFFVFSCEDFFLEPEPIGHINSYDSEYTGDIEGRAEIKISSGTTEIENNSTYTLSGSLEVYETHQFSFTIENKSIDTELNLTGSTLVSVSGADANLFSISAQPSAAISAGSSTTFTLDYAPTEAGTNACILTIENDDADKSPFVINISAIATFTPLGVALADDFASSGATIISDRYLAPREVSAGTVTLGGDIIVQAGATLTIYEGVSLNMGTYQLIVNGTLDVVGTDSNRVRFEGSGWGGITVAGDANINGADIRDFDPTSGFAVESTGGDVTMTNCRVRQPGNSSGFLVSDSAPGATFHLSNNLFIGLLNNGYGIEVRSNLSAAITMNVVYNTFIGKGDSGFAVSSYDDDSSSVYNFENNIFANDDDYATNYYLGVLEFQYSAPVISASNNVYDDRPIFDYSSNLDADSDNLDIAWDNAVIFEDIDSNDYRLKQTSTYPSLAQANNIAELVGSLTNGHANEVGAYGNGGYPPDFNE